MAEYKNLNDKKLPGRPRLIPKIWNEEIKQKILDAYKEGQSDIAAIVTLDITKETFYKLVRADRESLGEIEQDFVDSIKKGRALSQAWWEEMGRKGTIGVIDSFNNGAFVFNMKNRFKPKGYDSTWADKVETHNTNSNSDKVDVQINLSPEKN
jgi:hypothetical protein